MLTSVCPVAIVVKVQPGIQIPGTTRRNHGDIGRLASHQWRGENNSVLIVEISNVVARGSCIRYAIQLRVNKGTESDVAHSVAGSVIQLRGVGRIRRIAVVLPQHYAIRLLRAVAVGSLVQIGVLVIGCPYDAY